MFNFVLQPIYASQNHSLDGLRDCQLFQFFHGSRGAPSSHERISRKRSHIYERTHYLFDEERMPFGLLKDDLSKARRKLIAVEQIRHQNPALIRRERCELDFCITRSIVGGRHGAKARCRILTLWSAYAYEQDRNGCDEREKMFDELRGGPITPLQVFEHQNHGT